jgi:hypothetical protein
VEAAQVERAAGVVEARGAVKPAMKPFIPEQCHSIDITTNIISNSSINISNISSSSSSSITTSNNNSNSSSNNSIINSRDIHSIINITTVLSKISTGIQSITIVSAALNSRLLITSNSQIKQQLAVKVIIRIYWVPSVDL